jgi:hypothetical protein
MAVVALAAHTLVPSSGSVGCDLYLLAPGARRARKAPALAADITRQRLLDCVCDLRRLFRRPAAYPPAGVPGRADMMWHK